MDVLMLFMVAVTMIFTMSISDTVDDIRQGECPMEAEDA